MQATVWIKGYFFYALAENVLLHFCLISMNASLVTFIQWSLNRSSEAPVSQLTVMVVLGCSPRVTPCKSEMGVLRPFVPIAFCLGYHVSSQHLQKEITVFSGSWT